MNSNTWILNNITQEEREILATIIALRNFDRVLHFLDDSVVILTDNHIVHEPPASG